MPKQVDHDAHRQQLAQQAAELFSKHGYTGLGMRQIAAELGVSKSALYHYFPTKKALFHACTELVTQFDAPQSDTTVKARTRKKTDPIHELITQIKNLEPSFASELSLLVDYLRGRSQSDIATDPSMQLANERYRQLIANYVDEKHASPVLCLMLGALLMRYFNGGQTDFDALEAWLRKAL